MNIILVIGHALLSLQMGGILYLVSVVVRCNCGLSRLRVVSHLSGFSSATLPSLQVWRSPQTVKCFLHREWIGPSSYGMSPRASLSPSFSVTPRLLRRFLFARQSADCISWRREVTTLGSKRGWFPTLSAKATSRPFSARHIRAMGAVFSPEAMTILPVSGTP